MAEISPVNNAVTKTDNIFTSSFKPPSSAPISTDIVMTAGKTKMLTSHQKLLPLKFGRKPRSPQPSPPKMRSNSITASGVISHSSWPNPEVLGPAPGGKVGASKAPARAANPRTNTVKIIRFRFVRFLLWLCIWFFSYLNLVYRDAWTLIVSPMI